ncbi:MAG TPA: hypothetical protein VGM59_05710 [Dongiaceae bacterium]|jgi:hypothetical protein
MVESLPEKADYHQSDLTAILQREALVNTQPDYNIFLVIGMVITVPMWIAMIWAEVRIVQKAGYSGWCFLWTLVPIANIVVFFIFAFRPWPIERRLASMETNVFR